MRVQSPQTRWSIHPHDSHPSFPGALASASAWRWAASASYIAAASIDPAATRPVGAPHRSRHRGVGTGGRAPAEVLTGYAEVLKVLQSTPWSGRPQHPANPDAPVRRWAFGPDQAGQVVYLVLEEQ